jgi:hypothetical protein
MKTLVNTTDRASKVLGTAMAMVWTLWLGPVGLGLLLAVFYGMTTGNHSATVLGTILLFVPFFLTLTWGCVNAADALRRQSTILRLERVEANRAFGKDHGRLPQPDLP